MGIGDGRFGAAAPVAGGAGVGARALWTDLKTSRIGNAGNRSAARADGVNVDDRQRKRKRSDLAFGRARGIAVTNERHISRSAADIDRDGVVAAGKARHKRCAYGARGRA